MSSLPSFDTKNEPQIARSVEKFFKDCKVMELLRRCGLCKSKGIPLWLILSYIFSNVFPNRSMYMQQKSGKCTAGFSKNTYYRFMQNPHINWFRLTILLAERIVNGHLKDLTSDQRADCFVFDDSLYSRTGYKKTELAAK
ncbi:transposase, partial [Lactobacillus delbrueckii subsp. lactis]|nr:transposase [Lactobacillus delbrueckii subsp. lactis]